MSVLARAAEADLEHVWRNLGDAAAYRVVRAPEPGLVMVRGRAGGTGRQFNLGEMTVTRCVVELGSGTLGHAWVEGRRPRAAEIAAALDALLQEPSWRARVAPAIERLIAMEQRRHRLTAARAASTRVEFFTMVRGEG